MNEIKKHKTPLQHTHKFDTFVSTSMPIFFELVSYILLVCILCVLYESNLYEKY